MAEAKNGKSEKYAGVYWRLVKRLDGLGTERMYYIIYRRGGRGSKKIEEPVGRASQGMTEALANRERAARIAGKQSNVEKREDIAKEKMVNDIPYNLNQLWEIYAQDHLENPSMKAQNCRYKKHVASILGNKIASDIETSDIIALRRSMESKKLSAQSVKHGITLVRCIMRYAHKKGIFIMPQSLVFDTPKVDNQKTENMTAKQLRAYFQAIDEEPDQDAAALLRLALLTGMRKGALMALKWDDINFEQSIVRLRGDSAKNGKTVYLPLNRQAIEILGSITHNGDFVFPGKDGGQRKEFRRIARRVRDKAGLPASFRPLHGLRHCYASWLASSGQIDLYHLQKLLTHSSQQMTQRYAHLHDEALKRGADIAGDIFGGNI